MATEVTNIGQKGRIAACSVDPVTSEGIRCPACRWKEAPAVRTCMLTLRSSVFLAQGFTVSRFQGVNVSEAAWLACIYGRTMVSEMSTNDRRTRSTSSYVAFTDIERLFGDVAQNPTTQNIGTKRPIDNEFVDPFEQSDMELWSFKVLSDASCKQMIQVQLWESRKSSIPRRFLPWFSPRRTRLPRRI